MNPLPKIYILGHRGMAGSATHCNLEARGHHNRITCTHSELDLTNQQAGNTFFEYGSYFMHITKLICAGYSKFGKNMIRLFNTY